ncbi:hypothetical protein HAX54_011557 [Datura stramonium]|uniref:Uncharacterized protein n=1 Tax=Datura stramonium TaxID=4076 RepID=A0ABS8TI99_DATST|nr:hypothetical protein [Datura stramonium]
MEMWCDGAEDRGDGAGATGGSEEEKEGFIRVSQEAGEGRDFITGINESGATRCGGGGLSAVFRCGLFGDGDVWLVLERRGGIGRREGGDWEFSATVAENNGERRTKMGVKVRQRLWRVYGAAVAIGEDRDEEKERR